MEQGRSCPSASGSPDQSQAPPQHPTSCPRGTPRAALIPYPAPTPAELIHNLHHHPRGQLFTASLGQTQLGRREMSQRAIKH